MNSKFKIGDIVRVIDTSDIYDIYLEMANKLNVTNWQEYNTLDDIEDDYNSYDNLFIVKGMEYHFRTSNIVVWIERDGKGYLIDEKGLEIKPRFFSEKEFEL